MNDQTYQNWFAQFHAENFQLNDLCFQTATTLPKVDQLQFVMIKSRQFSNNQQDNWQNYLHPFGYYEPVLYMAFK